MPNLCTYSMKIKGTEENVMKFHKLMGDYELENHLWRMFETDIYDERKNDDGSYAIYVCGSCAWSIYSCCIHGYPTIDLFELHSKELGLEIECWADESGMCFQEHYIYNNGECLVNDSVDWYEYYYDASQYNSFDDFLKEYEVEGDYTEDDLDDDYLHIGGFDDYCEFSI